MARVDASEVKQIINTSLKDVEIRPFITAANITVTKLLGSSTDLSDNQKKEIERYLTAHLIACTKERQAKSEKAGDASITYAMETKDGIMATTYGQLAAMMDTTGTIANIGKKRVSLTAVTSFK